jgi:hypothetical protein
MERSVAFNYVNRDLRVFAATHTPDMLLKPIKVVLQNAWLAPHEVMGGSCGGLAAAPHKALLTLLYTGTCAPWHMRPYSRSVFFT